MEFVGVQNENWAHRSGCLLGSRSPRENGNLLQKAHLNSKVITDYEPNGRLSVTVLSTFCHIVWDPQTSELHKPVQLKINK